MLTLARAQTTIPKGSSIRKVLYPSGKTEDIIRAILYADERSRTFTEDFAKNLKGLSKYEASQEIWEFIKRNIPYVVDEFGTQDVKAPGQLITDLKGDCKSFSVFTGSLLQNLGIPYFYRFAAYPEVKPKTVTHVYTVVPDGKEEIIIDAVYDRFNAEKLPYALKRDIWPRARMQVSKIEGMPEAGSGKEMEQLAVAAGMMATAWLIKVVCQ